MSLEGGREGREGRGRGGEGRGGGGEGRGGEGRGGEGRGGEGGREEGGGERREGREGRDDCYTYSDGTTIYWGSFTNIDIYESVHSERFSPENQHLFLITDNVL